MVKRSGQFPVFERPDTTKYGLPPLFLAIGSVNEATVNKKVVSAGG
jgi:hypothetical protein